MAVLERVIIRGLRNLSVVEISPSSGVNWVVGENAAGKTAILEAIYCLSRWRSFRGRRFGPLISQGCKEAEVKGWLSGTFSPQSTSWRIFGSDRPRVDAVGQSKRFAVRLICESTHLLVEGDPSVRRRFVDWNVLLWEPEGVGTLRSFARAAAQRNAWLKGGGIGKPVWDLAYAEKLSELLHRRVRFFDELCRAFTRLTKTAEWFQHLEPFWRGLDPSPDRLLDRLGEMRAQDRLRGFTYLGPSRWDFAFRCKERIWAGSRGEGKVLGVFLQLAAESVVAGATGQNSIWLVDDLDAELSSRWSSRVLGLIKSLGQQVFVTGLPGKSFPENAVCRDDAMFHVEHGVVMPVSVGVRTTGH